MSMTCNVFWHVILLVILGYPLSLFALGCFITAEPESVMTQGMVIEATNRYGRIKIEAGIGTLRTFSWDDVSESVSLRRRPARWQGSLGLYSPGGGSRVHLIVEEGQQHFCSEDEAREWLLRDQYRMNWSFASNGLVVGWNRSKKPETDYWAVGVLVWQIYINGQKPTSLASSCGFSAWVTQRGLPCARKSAHIFVPSKPRLINGRLYSGKVLDLMEEKGVIPDEVENTIMHGDVLPITAPKDGWKYFQRRTTKRMFLVTVDTNGRIVMIQL